jgi:hypothetical protein
MDQEIHWFPFLKTNCDGSFMLSSIEERVVILYGHSFTSFVAQ